MTIARLRAAALATILIVTCAPALAATPTPKPLPIPSIAPPKVPLHTEYVVEVNKKGQVVRIKSGKPSKSHTFNVQTYGNALQMWIRKPDGTATVGLFKVTYDYNPKTRAVSRNISLVSMGGNWADEPGAATTMIDTAKREVLDAQKLHEKQSKSLPSLHEIIGSPSPSPSPHR